MSLIDRAKELLQLSEDECISALKQARWPNGFRCPRCDSRYHYAVAGRRLPLYECAACGYQCSLIAGTILERSRVPLRKWMAAIALVAESGISAVSLSRIIEVTYKTAWLMLHKIREAMARHNDRDALSGLVRFDTALYGWRQLHQCEDLHRTEHPFIIGASISDENRDGHPSKIILMQDSGGDTYFWKITAQGARKFMKRHVDQSASVIEFKTENRPFQRPAFSLRGIGWDICNRINWVHRGIGAKHLQQYLHEQAYRYNRRHNSGMTAFMHLFDLACSHPAPALRTITNRSMPGRPSWGRHIDSWTVRREFESYVAQYAPFASAC